MPPSQALMLAEEKGMDLVEIAATATPPVCRIMNSGKFFYQQSKREAEARKHQRHIQVKEVKFRPKIDEHDFQFKLRNAERFLSGGNKVKSVVIFRGREVVHMEVGRRHLERLAQELSGLCNVESPPKKEGNTMVQILAPKKDAAPKKVAAEPGDEKKAGAAKKSTEKKAPPEGKPSSRKTTESKAGTEKKGTATKAAPEGKPAARKAAESNAGTEKKSAAKKTGTARKDGASPTRAKKSAGEPAGAN
jgi:translation initiation factor IF-3